MTFKSLSSAGLAIALSGDLMGEKFTMRGQTYTGIIDDITAAESFNFGGSVPSEPVSVTMKKRTFSPALNLGERVTIRSRVYIVRQITQDEISTTLICDVPEAR